MSFAERKAVELRLLAMLNEDYDRELLAIVTSCCVLLAAAVSVFDTSPSPSVAKSAVQASMSVEQQTLEPVRIVGTPFVPNTNPGQR